MEWSIHEVAQLAGTTSRTLRHYGELGIVRPSRVGSNGYRYYDAAALTRLQRVLLMRGLGVGLRAIAAALDDRSDDIEALVIHQRALERERDRLDRQIASVESTIMRMEAGEPMVPEEMFDGFDNAEHKVEIEERWGAKAYSRSSNWWDSLGPAGRRDHVTLQHAIEEEFATARAGSLAPDDSAVQAIVERHAEWIAVSWGDRRPTAEQFRGLGDLYVADERFGRNYGGTEGARFVRDAMAVYSGRL